MKSFCIKLSTIIALCALPVLTMAITVPACTPINHGDVSFQMVCSILVLFMALPGLVMFYGG